MVTMGSVISSVIESVDELDKFPDASLYQAYNSLLPSPVDSVYKTVSLNIVVDIISVQPESDKEGVEALVEI